MQDDRIVIIRSSNVDFIRSSIHVHRRSQVQSITKQSAPVKSQMLKTLRSAPATTFLTRQTLSTNATRGFTATTTFRMPEQPSKIDAHTDPSVTKQYDSKTSAPDKFQDFYEIADRIKTSMFNTYRPGVGVRSPLHHIHPSILTCYHSPSAAQWQ